MNIPRVGLGRGLPNTISPSSALGATCDLRPEGVQSPSSPQPWRTSAIALSESRLCLKANCSDRRFATFYQVFQTVCVPAPEGHPREEHRALGQDNNRTCVQVSTVTAGRGCGWDSVFWSRLLSCREAAVTVPALPCPFPKGICNRNSSFTRVVIFRRVIVLTVFVPAVIAISSSSLHWVG